MNRLDEAALAAYLDRYMQARARLLDQRFFRGTVTAFSRSSRGPFVCTVAPVTSPTSTLQALAANPGYVPTVGDDVECCWRDLNTAYVLWSVNSASLGNPYRARVYRSAATTVASGTWTVLPFDTVDYDTQSMATLGTGAHFVAPFGGSYAVSATWSFFAAGANGLTALDAAVNVSSGYSGTGGTRLDGPPALASQNVTADGFCQLRLNPGDAVYFWAIQNTGAAVTCLVGTAPMATYATIRFLG